MLFAATAITASTIKPKHNIKNTINRVASGTNAVRGLRPLLVPKKFVVQTGDRQSTLKFAVEPNSSPPHLDTLAGALARCMGQSSRWNLYP